MTTYWKSSSFCALDTVGKVYCWGDALTGGNQLQVDNALSGEWTLTMTAQSVTEKVGVTVTQVIWQHKRINLKFPWNMWKIQTRVGLTCKIPASATITADGWVNVNHALVQKDVRGGRVLWQLPSLLPPSLLNQRMLAAFSHIFL